jgi:arginine/lysine/ornithine decarboxylase
MPGHKGKIAIDSGWDITEIPGADNLHMPNGIIEKAQNHVRDIVGSKHTLFCVNGSSVGIMASILSVCKQGDTLIADEGCHISILNTIKLFNIKCVFINRSILTPICISEVEEALRKNTNAKAILITSPTYYGICTDIKAVAKIAHKNNMSLIVDEAHGAHFGLSDRLPISSVKQGADICVQSAHKTLGTLTQGAALHICSDRISKSVIAEKLSALQTTSPSYLVMSSIESGYANVSKSKLDTLVGYCEHVKEVLNSSGKYKCLECDDKTRLVIGVGKNVSHVAKVLRKKFNIYIEYEDGNNLILMPSIYNKKSDFIKLEKALLAIDNKYITNEKLTSPYNNYFRK